MRNQCIRFESYKVDIGMEGTCDLLRIKAALTQVEKFIVLQSELSGKNVGFIFHPQAGHIEKIELLEAADFHRFCTILSVSMFMLRPSLSVQIFAEAHSGRKDTL